MNIGWKDITSDMLEPIWRISPLKKPELDEKDTTIESDFKQKMMPWWNWTESSSSGTNPEIETSHCTQYIT